MPLTITPLSPVFGARVSGLNTGGPASARMLLKSDGYLRSTSW